MKDTAFSIRISSDDLNIIKEKAKQARLSQSDYDTRCCLGKQVVVIEDLKEVLKQQRAIGNNLNQLTVLANMGRVSVLNLDSTAAELAKISDVVLIAGSANSSNSNRLREVAESQGTRAYLVDDSSGIDLSWLEGVSSVGLSAGASAPEYIVEEIIEFLNKNGATALQEVGSDLNERTFPLPRKGLP